MAASFKVKAIYDYASPHEDDLNFSEGQVITVTEAEEDDWYTGNYVGADGAKKEGLFPRNFVEKYEPEIPIRPSRPSRPKKDSEPSAQAAEPTVEQAPPNPPRPVVKEAEPEEEGEEEVEGVEEESAPLPEKPVQPAKPVEKVAPAPEPAPQSRTSPPPNQEASRAAPTKQQPPAVTAKPASSAFKDRIAAFNKPAAAPITPFKPQTGSGGTGFIKKPFVAPPPSKNAYVPPPREPPPQKVYRREEDTNVVQPPPPSARAPETEGVEGEEQPKPTSLKDRIALLQKQQLEQQQKNAEAAQKKEKPKKPPKRRTDSSEQVERAAPLETPVLKRVDTSETVGKHSADLADDEAENVRSPADGAVGSPPLPARELTSDTNDADRSDTEDAGLSTGREDNEEKLGGPGRTLSLGKAAVEQSPAGAEASPEAGSDDAEDEEEEDDVDPEVRRRLELRERMAKMSGGMGMMGMFGPPGGIPASGARRPSKPSKESTRATSGDQEVEQSRAPPVPLMAIPGLTKVRSPEPVESEEVELEEEAKTPNLASSKARASFEVPDIEDVENDVAPTSPSGKYHMLILCT